MDRILNIMNKKIDSLGREIIIFDDLFPKAFHQYLYGFVLSKKNYSLGFQDTEAIERLSHKYYTADFGVEDLEESKLFDEIYKTPMGEFIKDKQLTRATINTSVPTQTNFPHTHINNLSFIYYLNLDWKPEWAGETLFYNDKCDEIEFASIYKPNRGILFDGAIPHTLRTQSITAPHYRFSLAMFFDK